MNDIMSSCLLQNKAPRLLALILDVPGTQHERLYRGKEIRTPASICGNLVPLISGAPPDLRGRLRLILRFKM